MSNSLVSIANVNCMMPLAKNRPGHMFRPPVYVPGQQQGELVKPIGIHRGLKLRIFLHTAKWDPGPFKSCGGEVGQLLVSSGPHFRVSPKLGYRTDGTAQGVSWVDNEAFGPE